MKINDTVEYRSELYKVLWIGKTKSGKYMAKLRQNGSTLTVWALANELKQLPKVLRFSGFTPSVCEDCGQLCKPGTTCSSTGEIHS